MRKASTLILLIALLSCKKEFKNPLPSNPASPQAGTSLPGEAFYFKARFNNDTIHWIVPDYKNGDNLVYRTSCSFGRDYVEKNCSEGYCNYITGFTQIYANNAALRPQISVGWSLAAQTQNRQEIRNLIIPGPKTYAPGIRTTSNLYDPSLNGVTVYYTDATGKGWGSNGGSQAGSSFESVSVTEETRSPMNLSYEKIWKARFSCKLYDENGNFIEVKNGEIQGAMIPR